MTTRHLTLIGALSGFLITLFAAPDARTAVPRSYSKSIQNLAVSNRLDFSKGLNLKVIKPIRSMRAMQAEDIARIIPEDLTPTSNSGQIAAQILDHSLSNFFNSDTVRNSEWGRAAHEVEQKMESNIAFGGNEPESVTHSFKFAMRAAQTKALIEYSGLMNAQISYTISQQKMNFEVHEKLASQTQVVFNHINSRDDRTDMFSLRWNW